MIPHSHSGLLDSSLPTREHQAMRLLRPQEQSEARELSRQTGCSASKVRCLALLTLLGLLSGCSRAEPPKPSPDGRFLASVPIRPSSGPPLNGRGAWTVTITGTNGVVEYEDTASRFAGWLMVYWGWDPQTNRLWLYNSDDGYIWRWELNGTKWVKIQGEGDYRMPKHLLPHYKN